MGSEPNDGDDSRAPEESGGGHPQERAASELTDRSAENVSRRYDATKESVHEGHHDARRVEQGAEETEREQ